MEKHAFKALNWGGDPLKGDIKLPIKTFATIYLTEELKRKKVFVVLKGLSHEIDPKNVDKSLQI
jgi:hypothetical protein